VLKILGLELGLGFVVSEAVVILETSLAQLIPTVQNWFSCSATTVFFAVQQLKVRGFITGLTLKLLIVANTASRVDPATIVFVALNRNIKIFAVGNRQKTSTSSDRNFANFCVRLVYNVKQVSSIIQFASMLAIFLVNHTEGPANYYFSEIIVLKDSDSMVFPVFSVIFQTFSNNLSIDEFLNKPIMVSDFSICSTHCPLFSGVFYHFLLHTLSRFVYLATSTV
jgi:hypothetical protein